MGDGFGSFFDLEFLCGCEHFPFLLSKYGEHSQPHIFVKVMDRRCMPNCILITHECVLIRMLGIVSRSGVLGPVLVNSLLCQLDLVFR